MNNIKNHFRKIILAVIVAVFSVGTVTSISMVSSTKEAAAAEAQYLWPVPSSTKINQYYHDPNHNPNHDGIDIGGASGCDIVASKSGTVIKELHGDEKNWGGYGNGIVIDHGDGWYTHYAHMSYTSVSQGQYVSQGQKIGGMGATGIATGVHLHFAIATSKYGAGGRTNCNPGTINYIYSVIPPSSGRQQVDVSSGYYVFQSAVGAKNLDVSGANKNHNGNINIWDAHGAFEGQIFYINKNTTKNRHYIQNINSKLFVSSYGNTNANGVNVVQANGDGSDGQHWIFEDAGNGYVYIKNLYGYYLDVNNGTDANGTNVQVWTYNGGAAQKWKLVKVSGGALKRNDPPGSYIIKSKIGNRFLDTSGRSKENGANMLIWYPNGAASQIFDLNWAYSREATFKSKNSGLAVECAIRGSYGNVVQSNDHPQWYQSSWFMEDAGDGYVYLRNLWGYYLDVYNSEDKNGTNVQTWPFNGGNNQKWKLTKVSGKEQTVLDDGDYIIYSKIGNKVLNVQDNGTSDGSKLQIMSADKAKGNIFTIGRNGTLNATWIKRKDTDKFVDSSGQDAAGTARLWSGVGGYQQNWYLEDAGDGYYYIRNGWGYYLDVDDSVNEDGRRVLAWGYNGGDNQKWKFVKYAPEATSISLDIKPLVLDKGKSGKLTATVKPSNATNKTVTWSSSNTGVAKVDKNGNVTAVNHGTAKITAKTSNGKTAACEVRVKFIDVTNPKSWCYKPIYWAADNNIATGTDGKFYPASSCTREQAMAFLWRMAGRPEPKSMKSKFSDVKDTKRYSYKAIMWGTEKGIITGQNGKFNPGGTCTREQIVTMIWRLAGKPEPKTKVSKFKDVTNTKSYSYKAILWAQEKGITTGTDGKFYPTGQCKRREIVAFIYRYKN